MRVAVIRNKPQIFIALKQGPACSICAILLQPMSVSPFWRVLQAWEVNCQQSLSESAFLQLLCAAYKINLPHSMSGGMLTHLKSLKPVFEARSFQCLCFLLLWEGLGILPNLCRRAENEPSLSTPIPWDGYSGIILILSEIIAVYAFDLTHT